MVTRFQGQIAEYQQNLQMEMDQRQKMQVGVGIFIVRTLVVAKIAYGWPPNHCLGYLGIQKFLLPFVIIIPLFKHGNS